MNDERSADTLAPRLRTGVHRLQFDSIPTQLLEGGDSQEMSVGASAEKGDAWLTKRIQIQGEHTTFWGDLTGKREVPLEQGDDLGGRWILDGDIDVHPMSFASTSA